MRYLSIFVYCAYFAFVLVLADRDDVVFRDNYNSRNHDQERQQPPGFQRAQEPSQTFRVAKSIPLDLIQEINSITDEKEFVERFMETGSVQSPILSPVASRASNSEKGRSVKRPIRLTDVRHLARDTDIEPHQIASTYSLSGATLGRLGDGVVDTRFGGNEDSQSDKKNVVPTPRPAICQPELRTVNLRDTDDPTLVYFPSCTRVDRCGGCCSHDLLSCQPMNNGIEYKNFSVMVGQYNGGHKLESRGKKVVTVETHTKCKCDCKIKEKDCTSLQEYVKKDCRCVCRNKQDESDCNTKYKTRLWNPSTCSCQCREVQECSTGLSFDQASCSCQPYPKSFSPDYNLDRIDRNRYNIGYREQ